MKMQLSLVHDERSAQAWLRREGGADPDPEMVNSLLVSVAELDHLEFVPHQNEMVREMLDLGLRRPRSSWVASGRIL